MDRRFLSDPRVIKASRRFVCIRLSTYEDREEAKVLESLFLGRSGQLENTTFALLAADGATPLVRPGRSPDWAFKDAGEMASFMTRAAKAPDPKAVRGLPVVATPRLALNVAACEGLPLVVVKSKDAALSRTLAPLAWGPLRGRCVFAGARESDPLEGISGDTGAGIIVVQAGAYGQKGQVIAHLRGDEQDLSKALRAACAKHRAHEPSGPGAHVRAGRRLGVFWKTQLPVTDPGPCGR